MGKGDKKTPKGKRFAGSYGNARPHKATTKAVAAPKVAKPAKPAAKPAVAKAPVKTVVKKAAPAAK
ncbi:MAG: 30S ribosomal protein THX [Proteobacteria bacterium]|nr:30S ribosomal protein THX [Pseudomonadota bacterium]